MNYRQVGDRIIVEGIEDFDIEQILECGQCFRFMKIADHNYVVIAKGKVLKVVQMEKKVIFYHTNKEAFEKIWIPYFDINRDYGIMKQHLSNIDSVLKEAVAFAPGIRFLQQDVWECLVSFIISQNKQIPHIKQVIKNISERFGKCICTIDECNYYAFPTVEQLVEASEQELRECKTGFRAPYIVDACEKIAGKEVILDKLIQMNTEEARNQLLKIKGVGPKIADCVLLFGVGKYDAFPTDVWVKRVMEYFYFKKSTNVRDIQAYAADHFGSLAGLAQQYLFYYAREQKIGK